MRGFTLTETLVALLLVALLSGIALPGYRDAMHRAHRQEARLALLQLRLLQERHYAAHLAYAHAITGAPATGGLGMSPVTAGGNYRLVLETREDGQSYTARAEALADARQHGDEACRRLAIDATGNIDSAPADGPWRGDGTTCWR